MFSGKSVCQWTIRVTLVWARVTGRHAFMILRLSQDHLKRKCVNYYSPGICVWACMFLFHSDFSCTDPFLVYVDTLFKENSTFKVSLKKNKNILKSKKEEHLVKPNKFLSYCPYVFGDVHCIILSNCIFFYFTSFKHF